MQQRAECRVAAVLLAAGESRRMGAANKLTLAINGVPLLRHTVQVLLASRLQEIVVVLGHEAQAMAALLDGLPVTLVENPGYREGQMSSVHAGLAALGAARDGVMICLTDQPLITPADIDRLIEAFARRTRGSILVPTHAGERGNPIILADAHRRDILDGGRNLGCRRLIERNPSLVETVEMADDHVVVDLDTPEDYVAITERLVPAGEFSGGFLASSLSQHRRDRWPGNPPARLGRCLTMSDPDRLRRSPIGRRNTAALSGTACSYMSLG